jgi:hypothetical protein
VSEVKKKKRREEKIAHVFFILKFKRENFLRGIVELGLATINILFHTFICLDLIV